MNWMGRSIGGTVTAFFALIFVGCGGGGGGDSSQNQPNQPQNLAPSTLSGQSLHLNESVARQIHFEPSGNIWTEDRDGTMYGGTFEYRPGGNSAELVLSESGVNSLILLTFASSTSGTYAVGENRGSFLLQAAQNSPQDPGPLPQDPDGQLAPASLDGRVMYGTRTYTSTGPKGQTHTYTFTTNRFHDSDPPEESDGAYVYQAAGDQATLSLAYDAPREFNGDRHELNMTFATETTGTFQSVYSRRDGTTIQINGTFQLE